MMLALLITVMSAFLALQSLMMVLPVPFASWNWICWVYAALVVIGAVMAVLNARRTVRIYKKQKVEMQKRQAQEAERARTRRLAQYLDDDIDIEKEAEKAEAERLAAEAREKAAAEAQENTPAADDTPSE